MQANSSMHGVNIQEKSGVGRECMHFRPCSMLRFNCSPSFFLEKFSFWGKPREDDPACEDQLKSFSKFSRKVTSSPDICDRTMF